MANSDSLKICEVDNDACKRQVRALCFHCSKNLCRIHLEQHAELIEEITKTELHSLADKFNELSSRFNSLDISPQILEQPFTELEKWRSYSHEKIDQMAENKRQEMSEKIEEYRLIFATKNKEQIEKINVNKKMILELIQDNDASSKQIADLQAVIDSTEKYLNSLHTLKIDTFAGPTFSFIDFHLATNVKLREFKITYIRLDGVIRHYYVKTRKNGTMKDLIKTFAQQYPLFEVVARMESNSITTIDHQPNFDLILPLGVYNHDFHKSYPEDCQLTSIKFDETIAFYETPRLISVENKTKCIFCTFQRLPKKNPFAWPILLFLHSDGCRGHDVLDVLHNSIVKHFPSITKHNQHLYNASIVFNMSNRSRYITKILNNVLEDAIDLNKDDIKLIVDIDEQIADTYEQNKVE